MAANRVYNDCMEQAEPAPSPLPKNEGFNRIQTLYLIDLMRQHITMESEGLPESLSELNGRLRNAKPCKKLLWKETAESLGSHFNECFSPDKVARKWNTLVDAYKKVKDSNRSTGKGTMRFQFFREMDELLGGQRDVVVIPVVGTSEGLEVHRPEVLGHNSSTALAGSLSSPVRNTAASPTPHTSHNPLKRRRGDDELLEFLRQSEEASQRRHQETLAQLMSAQQSFEALMTKLIDKL